MAPVRRDLGTYPRRSTFKGRLDPEKHRGGTPGGVVARVMHRILALTAAIWHNDHTSQPLMARLPSQRPA